MILIPLMIARRNQIWLAATAAALWHRHFKAVAIGALMAIALFVVGGRFLPDLFG